MTRTTADLGIQPGTAPPPSSRTSGTLTPDESEEQARRQLIWKDCYRQGNIVGMKWAGATAVGCVAANHILNRTWQAYRHRFQLTGKVLTGSMLCYAVFYTAEYYSSKCWVTRQERLERLSQRDEEEDELNELDQRHEQTQITTQTQQQQNTTENADIPDDVDVDVDWSMRQRLWQISDPDAIEHDPINDDATAAVPSAHIPYTQTHNTTAHVESPHGHVSPSGVSSEEQEHKYDRTDEKKDTISTAAAAPSNRFVPPPTPMDISPTPSAVQNMNVCDIKPPSVVSVPTILPMTPEDQVNQLIQTAKAIDTEAIRQILTDDITHRTNSTQVQSMRQVAQRIAQATITNATKDESSAESKFPKSASSSLTAPLPLPIPRLISHVIGECILSDVTVPTRTLSGGNLPLPNPTSSSVELLVGIGKKLGEGLMQGASLLEETDLEAAWRSIARAVNVAILSPEADKTLSHRVRSFLKSLGFACPPFLLYCLLHLLDQHVEASVSDLTQTSLELSQLDGIITSTGEAAIRPFDFIEQSYLMMQLIEQILLHHTHPTQTSAIAAPASSSASVQLFQSQLNWFGMDWREVWQKRFVQNRMQSCELALMHPMIMEYIWKMQGMMQKNMQLASIDQLLGGAAAAAPTSTASNS